MYYIDRFFIGNRHIYHGYTAICYLHSSTEFVRIKIQKKTLRVKNFHILFKLKEVIGICKTGLSGNHDFKNLTKKIQMLLFDT